MYFQLTPFRPCPLVAKLTADFSMDASRIDCSWQITGDVGRICWPEQDSTSGRITGLWEHTCLEFFIGPLTDATYVEFNLSPSGAWNAFAFSDVRSDMHETDQLTLDDLRYHRDSGCLTASAMLTHALSTGLCRLGISAVLETVEDGKHSLHYFALSHIGGRPDFHNKNNWTNVFE